MNEAIFKYELSGASVQEIEMPAKAKVLCIQVQRGVPCLWCLVKPDSPLEKRTFEGFATGQQMPDGVVRDYIGSYQLQNGMFVFHLFEILALL